MKLVIVIPDEDYNNIEPFLNGETIKGGFNLFKALEIIKNGKPLPKEHGRLIDESKIDWLIARDERWTTENRIKNTSKTVIEADKESAE